MATTAVPDEDSSARAEEAAEQWLEAIERTLRRHEIDALKQWLKVPLHRKAIVDRCRLWHGPDILAVLAELIPVESFSRRVERNYGRLTLAIFLAVSGISFATILIALGKWWPDPNRPANPLRAEQSFQTPLGGRRVIRLPDGGIMALNASTQVIVSYGPRFRDVTLVRGEAEFRVVADPERAFRVNAGSRQVVSEHEEAQFVLRRLTQGDLELTVVRGQISVPAGRSRVAPSPALLRARVSVGDHVFGASESGVLGPAWQSTRFLTAAELDERVAWNR
jgi:transmembrane sensor